MKAKTQQDEDTGAHRLLCEPQATAIHRATTLRTAHNDRAPTRVPTSLRGGTYVLRQKPKGVRYMKPHTKPAPDLPKVVVATN